MKVLFLGDVVGRSGVEVVKDNLQKIQKDFEIDFTIVNGENAADGFGITEDICKEFYSYGVDVITTGNHLWDQKEINDYIDRDKRLLKPFNFAEGTPGIGFNKYVLKDGKSIVVINIMGNLFMRSCDNAFFKIEQVLGKLENEDPSFIFVDFHAEATSEKMAMGHHLDGRVTAVVGTHTHVPTADATILVNGTAYQTDVGMCGDYNSVIGMNKENSINRFLKENSSKHFPAKGEATLSGVIVDCDVKTGLAKNIESYIFGAQLKNTL